MVALNLLFQKVEPIWMKSFEIGGQRLMEEFHQNDPITTTEILTIKSYLEINLQPLFKACDLYRPKTLIGSSGSFETLSEIYQRKMNKYAQEKKLNFPFQKCNAANFERNNYEKKKNAF